MTPELLTILPNLSIGVVAIAGLIYVVIRFLEALDKRANRHEAAMQEREEALRGVEKDVRTTIFAHLQQSTRALEENTKILARVVNHLEK